MRAEDDGVEDVKAPRALAPRQEEPREDGYNASALDVRPDTAVQMAAIARERFQLEAMLSQARMYPRDELTQWQQIATAAKRPTFAARAEYKYPRGGKPVVGVSVKAARPLALYWKYIRFGWTITRYDEEGFGVRGYAHDLQNGSMREQDTEGKWAQQRKDDNGRTNWVVVTDERDRREIMSKAGAIAERNCILAVIPPDIVEDFISQCRKTNVEAAKGDLAKNRGQTIRAMIAALGEYGVTAAMIETRVGHSVETMNEEELAELRAVWNGLQEGQKVGAFFDAAPRREAPTVGTIDLSAAKVAKPVDPPGGAPHPRTSADKKG